MRPPNEEKITFIMEDADYCYRIMPFGLKNMRASYQRVMDRIFKDQIGRNVEVYINDMVIKSQSMAQYAANLEKVFTQVWKYDMCLNHEKFTFGVGGGKFLGFMITYRGIEANPNKCVV